MTTTEQQARHEATMRFLRGGKDIAEDIARELKRLEEEERKQQEREWQDKQCIKPTTTDEEEDDE